MLKLNVREDKTCIVQNFSELKLIFSKSFFFDNLEILKSEDIIQSKLLLKESFKRRIKKFERY